jgi:hypothetical protein
MSSLTREQILAADDRRRERIEVPEWGGTIWVRTMTAGGRDAYEAWLFEASKGGKTVPLLARARLVVACATDEAGARLFEDGDVQALAEKSAPAVELAAEAAKRVNVMTVTEAEALEKN